MRINTSKKTYLSQNFKTIFFASTMSILVEYLVLLSDKIIAGHILNTTALSALTLVEPFFSIIIFFAYLVADGSDMLIAYEKSKGDNEKANQLFSQAILLGAFFAVTITIVYCAAGNPILRNMCPDSQAYQYAAEYFKYIRVLPLVQILEAIFYSVILYQGGEKYCNVSSVVLVVLNIPLSIVFCYFIGIQGISLATVIANSASLIILLLFFIKSKKSSLRFQFGIHWNNVLRLFKVSFTHSSIYLLLAIFEFIMNGYLAYKFGGDAIIIFMMVMNIQTLYLTTYEGLTECVTANINVYLGEGNYLGVLNTMKYSGKIGIIESVFIMVCLFICAPWIAKGFGIREVELVTSGAFATRVFACGSILYCFADIYIKYYISIEKIWISMLLNLVRVSPSMIILGIVGGHFFGLKGVWIGMLAGLVLGVVLVASFIKYTDDTNNFPYLLKKDKIENQWIWDVPMTDEGIMSLVDQIEKLLTEEDIELKRRIKAMQSVEESQIVQKNKTKHPENKVIQCFLEIGDTITIILRNTGNLYNTLDEDRKIDTFEDYTSARILSLIEKQDYAIIRGDNRQIFQV